VLVSFVWGIFVFDERVHSRISACFAILCLMLGLFGMSYYSAPPDGQDGHQLQVLDSADSSDEAEEESSSTAVGGEIEYQGLASRESFDNEGIDAGNADNDISRAHGERPIPLQDKVQNGNSDHIHYGTSLEDASPPSLFSGHGYCYAAKALTKRQRGMAAAVFCGLWGGSILVPMKWAPSDATGSHYLISFAVGASIITIALWLVRFTVYAFQSKSLRLGYERLPSLHLRVMWLPGGISGLLWSIGNFFSLISVLYLGEGVGYPLVQTSILVSGLWGIFYFKEVKGTERISKWLSASCLTIFGILLLSYEHHEQ